MADKMPMETNPVGKPAIKQLGERKAMGAFHVRSGHGTEYGQVTASQSTSAKSGAQATQKGTFWKGDKEGTEYKQECYGGASDDPGYRK